MEIITKVPNEQIDIPNVSDIKDVCGDVPIPEEEDDTALLKNPHPEKLTVDLSVTLPTRLKAIELCDLDPEIEMADIINRIGTMFMFSEAKMIEKYLYEIVVNTKLDSFNKLLAARNLKTYSVKGYDCYDILAADLELPLSVRVDCMFVLLEDVNFRKNGLKYITGFFNDNTIDGYHRYKTVTSKATVLKEDLKDLLVGFIENIGNPVVFKILSCQYILTQFATDYELRGHSQKYLLGIIDDHQQDYNTRADATDILLQYGDDHCKQVAQLVLEDLALGGQAVSRTIYQNAQNVHTKSIEDSVNKILCELNNRVETKITFETALNEFTEYIDSKANATDGRGICPIRLALQRISVDKAIYGTVNMSLSNIFCKLWTYIKSHEHREELMVRLCEELEDSNQLCSSGYISRMMNCLSGITDLSLSISYEDQIIANMGAKLNNRVMAIEDEDYRDLVLEEMMLPSHMYSSRPNFMKFFRDNILSIREDLYQEFVGLMEDIDFDLYTKRAIMKYQGDFSI